MRLLDRYLLRELVVPLFYTLSGFLLIWIVADLLNAMADLRKDRLTGLEIAQYYLIQVPDLLVLILPIALLLAMLYALTNHARHHEITAIRAAGISLWRLSLPYFAVGTVSAAALLGLNEFVVPDSAEAAQQIRSRHQPATPGVTGRDPIGFTNSRDQRTWYCAAYNPDNGEMVSPVVTMSQADGSSLQLFADRAERVDGAWTFHNARLYRLTAATGENPERLLQTNVLARPDFSETPAQIRSYLKINDSLNKLLSRGVKRADVPIRELLNYLRLNPHPEPAERAWLYTKLHGRLAAPWICLVVVVIAIPFGAPSGRRNVFVGVASSILICFIYYVLQHFCLALGAGRHLAPWVAGWLPNVAFGVTGLWLTSRVR